MNLERDPIRPKPIFTRKRNRLAVAVMAAIWLVACAIGISLTTFFVWAIYTLVTWVTSK